MIIKLNKRLVAVILAAAIVSVMFIAADKPNSVKLPVIMYHHISVNEKELGKYVISPEQFKADLTHLKSKGYTTVTTQQLIRFVEGEAGLPPKPVLITFDDGYESFYAYAFPILKEMDMTAVLSVIGTYTELYSCNGDSNVNYAHVTWSQISEMAKSGYVEFANHTYDLHKFGDRQGCKIIRGENEHDYRKMLTADIERLQAKLTEVIGSEPQVFTYPFGKHCTQSSEVIKNLGFAVTLGCEEKVASITEGDPTSLYMLGRINRAHGKNSEAFFKNILE